MLARNFCYKELKVKAIYFLSRREYTYLELSSKLTKYTTDQTLIKQLLDELVKRNYLSNQRYIEVYLNAKSKRYGVLKLKANLISKLSDYSEAEFALKQLNEQQFKFAYDIWDRKFGVNPHTKKEYAKQVRFLQNRGFTADVIKKIVSSKEIEL